MLGSYVKVLVAGLADVAVQRTSLHRLQKEKLTRYDSVLVIVQIILVLRHCLKWVRLCELLMVHLLISTVLLKKRTTIKAESRLLFLSSDAQHQLTWTLVRSKSPDIYNRVAFGR